MTGGFIPPHGGYQKLLSYRKAEIAFDARSVSATASSIGAAVPMTR